MTLDYLLARNHRGDSNLLIVRGDRGNERNPIRTIYGVSVVLLAGNMADFRYHYADDKIGSSRSEYDVN